MNSDSPQINANSSSPPSHPYPPYYSPPYLYPAPLPSYSNAPPSSSNPYPVFYVPMYMAPPYGYYPNSNYNQNQNHSVPDVNRASTPFNYSRQRPLPDIQKTPEKEMKGNKFVMFNFKKCRSFKYFV